MKILHIASGDLWAGAEKQLYMLACALQQQEDIEARVVLLNHGQLADNLTAAGIPVTVFDERNTGSGLLFRHIRRLLKAERPDIVHTHRNKENILGGLAAASLGIPSLRTSHGAPEHAVSWFDLRHHVLAAADYLAGHLLQRRIVAVSRPLQVQLARRFGTTRVVLIHNGINTTAAPLLRERSTSHCWHIGIVGRLVPVKRVDLFIEIARRLDRQLDPTVNAKFFIIGDGPLRAELQQQVEASPWRRSITCTGHIPDAEKAIEELDILVLCSDHEGLPMVALEAFKLGTAVVTHHIGGLPELLENGQAGFLVEATDAAAFAHCIEGMIRDPASIAARTAAAVERLNRHYSANAMAASYVDLYRALCT